MCAKQVMRIEVNAIGFGLKDNNNGNAREHLQNKVSSLKHATLYKERVYKTKFHILNTQTFIESGIRGKPNLLLKIITLNIIASGYTIDRVMMLYRLVSPTMA
jgi:hypothetical protein